MKNILRLVGTLLLCAISLTLSSQTIPQGISYQAVALDPNGHPVIGVDPTGQPIENAEINVRIAVLDGTPTGPVLYEEQHTVLTDQYGLFTLTIGEGLVASGAFSTIDWASDKKYLQTKLDLQRTGNFILAGVQQLMSVPYAFVAQSAIDKDDADSDPSNELQTLSRSNDTLYLTNGGAVVLPLDTDRDPENELQHLILKNDSILLTQSTQKGIFLNSAQIDSTTIAFGQGCRLGTPMEFFPNTLGNDWFIPFEQVHTNLLFSTNDTTYVVDTNNIILKKYNFGLSGGTSEARMIYPNNIIDRDSSYFCGIRLQNNNSDTINTFSILDTNYVLVLDTNGTYFNHYNIDTLIESYTHVFLSAIQANKIYVTCSKQDTAKTICINIFNNNVQNVSLSKNALPLVTLSNLYWIKPSQNNDSILDFHTENNGTTSIKYSTPKSYFKKQMYQYALFNPNLLYYAYDVILHNPKALRVINIAGELSNSSSDPRNKNGKCYVDTLFDFKDLPYFALDYNINQLNYSTSLTYSNDSIIHFFKFPSNAYVYNGSSNLFIEYGNSNYLVGPANFNNIFFCSYNLNTNTISKLYSINLNSRVTNQLNTLRRDYYDDSWFYAAGFYSTNKFVLPNSFSLNLCNRDKNGYLVYTFKDFNVSFLNLFKH